MIVFLLLTALSLFVISTILFHFGWIRKNKNIPPFISDKSKNLTTKNICFTVAHPDDEVMFFGPTIRYLASFKNHRIHILSLTPGNYYGLGETRRREMKECCTNLVQTGFKWNNFENLEIVDEPTLPDHPTIQWNEDLCHQIISDYIRKHRIDVLVSFDEYGISSHANHCALNKILKKVKQNNEFEKIQFFKLETVNICRKYMFLFDLLTTLMLQIIVKNPGENLLAVNSYRDFVITIKSMLKHKSQLVWFRWLYIFSSRYMFINNIEKL
jgi:N-acetylglucosaminylphosphatidylinositol deacetylase